MTVTYSESEYKALKEKEDEMPDWLLILISFPISIPIGIVLFCAAMVVSLVRTVVSWFKDD